ncbi:MAG: hypothetical protein ONB16_09230 [candidate division KSB1 bacterium]|nr:hypothetical protein [candidate division KSB1 bacterium]MDZ7319976.1 hypothetical protein [candidate division KSB1 bacterium]
MNFSRSLRGSRKRFQSHYFRDSLIIPAGHHSKGYANSCFFIMKYFARLEVFARSLFRRIKYKLLNFGDAEATEIHGTKIAKWAYLLTPTSCFYLTIRSREFVKLPKGDAIKKSIEFGGKELADL